MSETTVSMRDLECWVCANPFSMSETLYQRIKVHGGSLYCPKGCHLGLGEGELQKAQKKAAMLQASLDQESASRREAQIALDAEHVRLIRLKKRVKNGVCPCCHRNFVGLRRHIANKHPEWKG